MTINFPKFPNNRHDKNRPIDPNMTVASSLDDPLVKSALPTGDNPAHNRNHQDMLTQTDQLQSDTLTEAQRALLKKHLKGQTRPTQKTKSLPLMPLLLGLILLAGGGVLGYMYQTYTQPTAPAPVAVKAPTATPNIPQAATTTPASGVTTTTVPATIPPTTPVPAVPASDKSTGTVVSNPANPTPATKLPPSDATPMPSPMNADGNPNTANPNGNNNATNPVTGNTTTPPPTPKSMPSDAVMPASTKLTSQPVTAPEANATTNTRPSDSPAKNTKSYEDFVKSSENTVFIEPPSHK